MRNSLAYLISKSIKGLGEGENGQSMFASFDFLSMVS